MKRDKIEIAENFNGYFMRSIEIINQHDIKEVIGKIDYCSTSWSDFKEKISSVDGLTIDNW